ncbi:hypothetical protein AB3S75_010985 [Citrus x aurantiifolia]
MVKLRQSRLQAKKWSTITLVLSVLVMLKIVLLTLLAIAIFTISIGDDDSLPNDLTTERRIVAQERGEHWTEIVAWEPRAFIYHNFLSKAECENLIELAKPHLVMAKVDDFKTGRNVASSGYRVRTGSGTFLKRGQDNIIRDIEKRIAEFTLIPPEHGEGIQVVHYEVGQRYAAHRDYFRDELNLEDGGQRMATLLMYLSDVEEGGETLFPAAKANFTSVPWWNDLSECAKKGLSIKPKRGDALLFWSIRPDATLDPSSLHAGCPVIKGDKWLATKWVHVHEYKL